MAALELQAVIVAEVIFRWTNDSLEITGWGVFLVVFAALLAGGRSR